MKIPYSILNAFEDLSKKGIDWALMIDSISNSKSGLVFIIEKQGPGDSEMHRGDTVLEVMESGLRAFPEMYDKINWNFEDDLLCTVLKLANESQVDYYIAPIKQDDHDVKVMTKPFYYLSTDTHKRVASSLLNTLGALIAITNGSSDDEIERYFIAEDFDEEIESEDNDNDTEGVHTTWMNDSESFTKTASSQDVSLKEVEDAVSKSIGSDAEYDPYNLFDERRYDLSLVDIENVFEDEDELLPTDNSSIEALTLIVLDGWEVETKSHDKSNIAMYFRRNGETIVVISESIDTGLDYFCDVLDDFSYFLNDTGWE